MQKLFRIDKITQNTLLSMQWRSILKAISSFTETQMAIQKTNLFLWIPIFFACGIGTYFSLPFEPPFMVSLFSLVLSAALYSMTNKLYKLPAIALLIFTAGFCTATYRTHNIDTPTLSKKISTTQITGKIFQVEKLEEGRGSRIILDVKNIEDLPREKTPHRVRLTIRKDENISVGLNVRILAGLNPPSEPLIPGGFDFRRYLYFQKIGAVGFVYSEPEILGAQNNENRSIVASFGSIIESIRRSIELRVYEVLPSNHAAIAAALLVGKKNAIDSDDQQAMRDGGLAHMLAISGLHVGIFSGTLFFIIRFIMACIPALALRFQIKKIAAVIAVLGAVFYMLIAGYTVPTQRAVLMISIVFLAIIIDRSPISLRLVAASALVVLAFRPESLLSVSFQMSFAAVTCLIYFYDVTRKFWSNSYAQSTVTKKAALYFLGICVTTVVASIATAPFALYHFGQVSFIGSVANLIAVPLFGFFIMPVALISLLLMPLGLDTFPLTLMGYGISGMLDVSYWAASLPHAVIRNAMWPFSAFVLINASVLFMMLWRGVSKFLAIPFLIVGLFLSQGAVMPDILVAGSHKLFMFRNDTPERDTVLLTSTRRNDRFVLKNWEKLYGLPEKSAHLLGYKGTGKNKELVPYQCGEQGCRIVIKGNKVSFVRAAYILKEECSWADLLISVEPIPNELQCQAPYMIDKFDTWEKGTHAVYLTNNSSSHSNIEIKTIAQNQGDRPWARFNDKSSKD